MHPILAPICLDSTRMHATSIIAGTWISLNAEIYAASNTGNTASKICNYLVTYVPAYIWCLTIISGTKNTLDAEINAASTTGTLLSASNIDVNNNFIRMAASNIFVPFAIDFDKWITCNTKGVKCNITHLSTNRA